MSLFINTNNGPIYNECTVNVYNGQTTVEEPQSSSQAEEVSAEPVVVSSLFTKKAKQENRMEEIVQSLQSAMNGRSDKARALVEEVRNWQKEGYVDANYNAKVMFDELNRLIAMPFQYPGFRKYYNE